MSVDKSKITKTSSISTSIPSDVKFVLKEYTGVGSGVYKHGTIVAVVDGQPQVVGSFIDESGEFSPGTVEIVRVK